MTINDLSSTKLSLLSNALHTKLEECLSIAEQIYERPFPYESVLINIRGKTAGQVRYYSNLAVSKPVLRFNPAILLKYEQQFIDEVVPHECAHLVVYTLYHSTLGFRKNIKPHGREWQDVMTNLYGLQPRVTHEFVVEASRKDKFRYKCGCEGLLHNLSVIRHNKILRQQTEYRCKKCRMSLVFKEKNADWVIGG